MTWIIARKAVKSKKGKKITKKGKKRIRTGRRKGKGRTKRKRR